MGKPSSIDDYDVNGMTALLYAIYVGDIENVRRLLDEGANPNLARQDDITATPVHVKVVVAQLMQLFDLFLPCWQPDPQRCLVQG